MASEILQKWRMSWEVEQHWKPRRVLMLLHECAAQPHLECLKNIQLKFLPPNTSLVQPVDTQFLKKSEGAVSHEVHKLHPRSK
jgi:hypothetical protein